MLPQLLCKKPLVFLGGISFPIFVVHGPLGQLFYKKAVATAVWGRNMASPQAVGIHWFFLVYWLTVLVFAQILQKVGAFAEEPHDWCRVLQRHHEKTLKVCATQLELLQNFAACAEGVLSPPGFFAPDVHTALQQRAAWFEGLGDSAVFDSENVESGSEQWDGEEKEQMGRDQKPTLTHKASTLPGSLCDLLAAGFARVETEDAAWGLNRLRKEVATLCDWAAAEKQGAGYADGQLQQLRKEVSEMGSTLKAQAEPELKNLPFGDRNLPIGNGFE
eukprot:s1157_g8.t1